jgi:hypothetical protein
MHYMRDGVVDRQARAELRGFEDWHAWPEREINARWEARGTGGNLGDRDAITVGGRDYLLREHQGAVGAWASWRVSREDPRTGAATLLPLATPAGTYAFGNPSATPITLPDGRPGVVTTAFVFGEGAAPGEAGEMIVVNPR